MVRTVVENKGHMTTITRTSREYFLNQKPHVDGAELDLFFI